ncbi:MAG TPA: apolipoprotein N-acyltransferase [Terriglobales bacterium]|nr:apolipoprotein N-acyltransferase [Terriglobales bacterium]
MRQIPASAWGLAILSGALQVLIFPSPGLYWLCWVALAPLIVAILGLYRPRNTELLDVAGREVRPGAAAGFLLGYSSGVIWYAGSCYWIYHVMHVYGGVGAAASAGIVVLFCLYLGLYHGLFGWLLARAARRGKHGIRRALLLAPFLWVAVELARARITGFPWDLLGTAQVNNLPLTRIATFTGVYGISFEIALINAAFAAAFVIPLRARGAMLGSALAAALLLQAGALVALRPAPRDRVATLVQSDIPILEPGEWTAEYFDRTIVELVRLSLPAAKTNQEAQSGPGLIVWPETPAPFYDTDPRFRDAVSGLARRANAYVLVGSVGVRTMTQHGQQGAAGGNPVPVSSTRVLNSAALVGPNGEWVARYDKVHLVPFGEYVPFRPLFAFAEKLTKEVGDFSRGSERRVLDLGGRKVGAFICYESVFPDEVRQFTKNGARLLVNISNDGWFGESGAPGQHLNMARMRAIENQRWLLRDTNTGITASIDPYGRVVARAPRGERLTLQAPYALISEVTFYTAHGDWFAWTCAIIALAGLLVRARFKSQVIWSKN